MKKNGNQLVFILLYIDFGGAPPHLLMLITLAIFSQIACNLQHFILLPKGIICANFQRIDKKSPFYKQFKSALINVSFLFIFHLH